MEKYKKIKTLGTCYLGKILLVEDNILSREKIVLKKIENIYFTPKEKDNIINKFNIIKSYSHQNIVNYIDCFVESQAINIVMEYADGGDLSQRIKASQSSKTNIPEAEVIHYFIQIAHGIQFMHHHNIIHRDLKPQNIFLTQTNVVKIGDLDDVKILETIHQQCGTTYAGTLLYMSPEQINFQSYDYKTDIWSLGCIIYELCTLQPPFNGNGRAELKRSITKGKYISISNKYSNNIQNLIKKMLSKNPKNRPTIDEILSMLLMITNPKLSLKSKSISATLKIDIYGCQFAGRSTLKKSIFDLDECKSTIDNENEYFLNEKKIIYKGFKIELHFDICDDEPDYETIFPDLFERKKFDCDAVIIVFSVENIKSFQDVEIFKRLYLKGFHGLLCLCANKIDTKYRVISRDKGISRAKTIKAAYFETSAITGEGVDNMFDHI